MLDFANTLIACPVCKGSLELAEQADAVCDHCGEICPWENSNWTLVPNSYRDSPLWTTWDVLQKNGEVSYNADPISNLSCGARDDVALFSDFCQLTGTVLDVGCGPHAWPSYFDDATTTCQFVGIDPLVGRSGPRYLQLRALAEHLPFRERLFDRVLFATSLDHFVDPVRSLEEASRVCKSTGYVCLWTGYKKSGALRKKTNAWYDKLSVPDGAEDRFHIKRLSAEDVECMLRAQEFRIIDKAISETDDCRIHHLFLLALPS